MNIIGVDLGRLADSTTLNILADRLIASPTTPHPSLKKYKGGRPPTILTRVYDVLEIGVLKGYSYPDIARRISMLCNHPKISKPYDLILDATGVGIAVFEMLRAPPYYLNPYGIVSTGGNAPTQSPWGMNVPKKDLIDNFTLLFSQERIKIPRTLEHYDKFEEQYNNFVRLANGGYGNLDESIHDDIVMGVAVALWYGENTYPPYVELPDEDDKPLKPFDPARHGLTTRR